MYTFNENSEAEKAIYVLINEENKSDRNVYFFQNVPLLDLGILPKYYSTSTNPRGFKEYLVNRFGSEEYCLQLMRLVVDERVDVSKESVDLLKICVDKKRTKKFVPTLVNAKILEVNGEQHYANPSEKMLALQLLRDWAKHDILSKFGCTPEEIRLADFLSNQKINDFIKKTYE